MNVFLIYPAAIFLYPTIARAPNPSDENTRNLEVAVYGGCSHWIFSVSTYDVPQDSVLLIHDIFSEFDKVFRLIKMVAAMNPCHVICMSVPLL